MLKDNFFQALEEPRPEVLSTGTYLITLKDIKQAKPRKYGIASNEKKRITFVFTWDTNPAVEIYKTVPATLKPNTKLIELARQLGGELVPVSDLINPMKLILFLKDCVGNHYQALITPNRENTYSNIESLKLVSKRGE